MAQFAKRSVNTVLVLSGLVAASLALRAEPVPPAKKPPITVRSPRECLVSPREVLKTLYYAVVAYDFAPQLIDEAIATLDLDPALAGDTAEAARLAIDLEQVLRTLCVPIHGVPEKTALDKVTLLDEKDVKISLVKGSDGLWRFDRDTVARIPAMSRAALAKFRDLQTERAALKEGLTDPSATMRRFLLDTFARDFYSAAGCLDLSAIDREERSEKGPLLARQLAFVMQRRGWLFLQEVPNQPNGPPFTWHADKSGRIFLERVHLEDGKEAWLYSKKTVRNIAAMYAQVANQPVDPRFVRLGMALPPLTAADETGASRRAPSNVPAQLGSPRAVLQGFFRAMDAAETRDSRLVEALPFLDLHAIPQVDRQAQGIKVATKFEAVLRKIRVESSALPDDWNAPPQILGEGQGVRIEIVRQRDGCWRFSHNTVNQAPVFFDKVAARSKGDRANQLDSARDTMSTFLTRMRRGEYELAAECLDLSRFRPGAQDEIGPMLAYKLKFIIDRIGRVYIQEVPDSPDAAPYVFYRGDLGRIVIARKSEGARKGCWLFAPETVAITQRMFRTVLHQPVNEASVDSALPRPGFWRSPGLWVRFQVPDALRVQFWRLQLYQWIGLAPLPAAAVPVAEPVPAAAATAAIVIPVAVAAARRYGLPAVTAVSALPAVAVAALVVTGLAVAALVVTGLAVAALAVAGLAAFAALRLAAALLAAVTALAALAFTAFTAVPAVAATPVLAVALAVHVSIAYAAILLGGRLLCGARRSRLLGHGRVTRGTRGIRGRVASHGVHSSRTVSHRDGRADAAPAAVTDTGLGGHGTQARAGKVILFHSVLLQGAGRASSRGRAPLG